MTWLDALKGYRTAGLVTVAIRALAALFEGLSLGLLIPLVYVLMPGSPGVDLAIPGGLRYLFEPVMALPSDRRVFAILVFVVVGLILKNGLAYFSNLLTHRLQFRIRADLRKRLFKKLLGAPYTKLLDQEHGRLLHTLYEDAHNVSYGASLLVSQAGRIGTVAILIMMMLIISWSFTLMIVVSLGLVSLGMRRLSVVARQLGVEKSRIGLESMSFTSEVLQGVRQVLVFGAQGRMQRQFAGITERSMHHTVQVSRLGLMVQPIIETATVVVVTSTLAAAVSLNFFDLRLVVPVVVAFLGIVVRLMPIFSAISSDHVVLKTQVPALELVSGMLNLPQAAVGGGRVFDGLRSEIVFENVDFAYMPNVPVLQGLTLRFRKGETTAIVGRSGAGKSTVVDLLVGLIQPVAGRILIDGQELRDFNFASWRHRIGYVSQDTFVFHGTIAENIAFGNPESSRETIEGAARQANAHDFILQLPQGYETLVGERGFKLSGGQRQRIAIARALLRDPDILILDEATSSLDRLSEDAIRTALERIQHQRTIIMIAHRLTTVEQADRINVLDKGRVIESGTHEELLGKRGTYWQQQTGAEPEISEAHIYLGSKPTV